MTFGLICFILDKIRYLSVPVSIGWIKMTPCPTFDGSLWCCFGCQLLGSGGFGSVHRGYLRGYPKEVRKTLRQDFRSLQIQSTKSSKFIDFEYLEGGSMKAITMRNSHSWVPMIEETTLLSWDWWRAGWKQYLRLYDPSWSKCIGIH